LLRFHGQDLHLLAAPANGCCYDVCCLVAAAASSGFQQLAGGLLASGQLLPYQESVVVDMLHKEVQRSMENQWQMARLETKRCVFAGVRLVFLVVIVP
jgi:hypothetical protein